MADDPPTGPGPPLDADRRARASEDGPGPWGPWSTIGWTALVAGAMLAVQGVTVFGFALARLLADPKVNLAALLEALPSDGMVLAVAALLSTPVVLGLVAPLAYARLPVRDYLALRRFPARESILAVLGLAAFLVASDALTHALGRPLVSPWMVEVYRTAWLPPLLVALLICAPLGEEVLFRGFFYRGIADSRWGPGLAIGFSSIAWALMHLQYDLYGIATIYLMGLYLGAVRHWTGSLAATILLHFLANAAATAEAAMVVGRGG